VKNGFGDRVDNSRRVSQPPTPVAFYLISCYYYTHRKFVRYSTDAIIYHPHSQTEIFANCIAKVLNNNQTAPLVGGILDNPT
jgi:hypothetical protein